MADKILLLINKVWMKQSGLSVKAFIISIFAYYVR